MKNIIMTLVSIILIVLGYVMAIPLATSIANIYFWFGAIVASLVSIMLFIYFIIDKKSANITLYEIKNKFKFYQYIFIFINLGLYISIGFLGSPYLSAILIISYSYLIISILFSKPQILEVIK